MSIQENAHLFLNIFSKLDCLLNLLVMSGKWKSFPVQLCVSENFAGRAETPVPGYDAHFHFEPRESFDLHKTKRNSQKKGNFTTKQGEIRLSGPELHETKAYSCIWWVWGPNNKQLFDIGLPQLKTQ